MIKKEDIERAVKIMQTERAKSAIHNLKLEQDKRNELTYKSTKDMELSFAKTSLERAKSFRTIILEYLAVKK